MAASLRPWGRSAIVGNTVGGLVLGIGMRWRETVVEIIDKHPNPDHELLNLRRCVLSANALQLLQDVGVTAGALEREGHLRPAGMWRFMSEDLDVIREGSSYPGASPHEATYHIAYGALLRALRREFSRFGGVFHHGCRAGAPGIMEDGSGFWYIQKEYGAVNEVECIVSTSTAHTDCAHHLFGEAAWSARPKVRFPMSTGWCLASDLPEGALHSCFPANRSDIDFVVVLARRCALHMWKTHPLNLPVDAPRTAANQIISWRLTCQPDREFGAKDKDGSVKSAGAGTSASAIMSNLHPSIRQMFARSKNVVHDEVAIPTAACSLDESAFGSRVTVLGNALLPVDLAELRGDGALVSIEDAASLVRKLYSQQYYRGFVPNDFRDHEMNSIARRMKLVQRDLQDFDVFLNAAEQIAEGKSAAQPQQIGDAPSSSPSAEEAKKTA